ncbi:MAG: glycosyltransferase [Anaerolineales bacterium]|nr:glycosyltransferase [Anaerolineales bacterium]
MRILYDGWPLAHAPLSPTATHLRELLTAAPAEAELLLALPAPASESLPVGVQSIQAAVRDRGDWEQNRLQALAAEHNAAAIHTTANAASLLGKVPTLVSPAEYTEAAAGRGRMAAAQAHGGLARAHILWPSDLPAPAHSAALSSLPPVASRTAGSLPISAPEEFVLYYGSGQPQALLRLLKAWTWAAGSIGEIYPLVIAGLDAQQTQWLHTQLPIFDLQEFVQLIQASPSELHALVQHSTAFIHPEAPPAWGSGLRLALAHGKAIVALQEPLTEAMLDTAGYLVAEHDTRSLGAAILTVVVEEGMRAALEQQAAQKSASWNAGAFGIALQSVYTSLV